MSVTSESTSVRSGYSFLKAAAVRLLDQTASSSDDVALINRYLLAGGTLKLNESIEGVHRHDPEFAAALRHAIDRLKEEAPVWKREQYEDGSEAWLEGS